MERAKEGSPHRITAEVLNVNGQPANVGTAAEAAAQKSSCGARPKCRAFRTLGPALTLDDQARNGAGGLRKMLLPPPCGHRHSGRVDTPPEQKGGGEQRPLLLHTHVPGRNALRAPQLPPSICPLC